jgi:hypothetical protein
VSEFVSDSTKCSASPDHADILETIQNAADDWRKQGYPTALAEVRDMANVGRALMTAIADNASSPPLKGWHPADCPSEIVVDLLNMLDDATRAAPPAMDREAVGITAEMLGEVMQEAWGEICDDAGAHPSDMVHGRGTVLHYRPSHWTSLIALRLTERLSTLSADAIRQGEVLDHKVAAFVADYEFRGDDGDFTPNDWTKAIIEDAIHGFLAQHPATPASHASDGGEA